MNQRLNLLKYHRVFKNSDTEYIGFLCRVVNFLEDVYEDAECSDIYISISDLVSRKITIDPVNCRYSINESIGIFSEEHGVENVTISTSSRDFKSFNYLYDYVIDKYRETLHYYILNYLSRTLVTGYEYYLGVLFSGDCFILEGEKNRVVIPSIHHCLSAHTHPSEFPYPSPHDIDEIIDIFINRGIGHIVVAKLNSMAIYRVKPITESDLEKFTEARSIGFNELMRVVNELESIRVKFF